MQFLWQHVSIFYQSSYLLSHNSKTIQSIFMKFAGEIDIVSSYTQKFIVDMDINLCCFYGTITTMSCQISYLFY